MSYVSFQSFSEMLEKCTLEYKDHTLFKTHNKNWTYSSFFQDVLYLADVLSSTKQIYVKIEAVHPYLFSASYFATVIVGKIAVLTEEVTDPEGILFINDSFISEKIKNRSKTNYNILEIDDNLPCTIIQSSGTTSFSKGVMLSHKNLLTELKMLIHYKPFPENEVYYHLLPYSHLFGLLGEFLIPFCTGGTICFSENALTLYRNFMEFKPTYLCIPPAIVDSIAKILQNTNDFAFATGGKLKTIISGGAFLHEETRSILSAYGIQVYIAYGLTECSPVISIERDGNILCGSVGQILPCCDVKIANDEILVSGDTVMLGYWNNPSATKSVIVDGWLHTGDMGYVDDNGFLFLTGRISNLIVFENGEKLIPESLENEINCITEVIESLVIAKRTGRNKSKIVIEILIYPRERIATDSLLLKVKDIANRFIPAGLLNNIYFLSEPLRRNSIGKIDRKNYKVRIDDNSDKN